MLYLELLETKELCHPSGFGHRGQRKERLRNPASCFFGRLSVRRLLLDSGLVFFPKWEHVVTSALPGDTGIPAHTISKEANRICWVMTPIKSDLSSQVNSGYSTGSVLTGHTAADMLFFDRRRFRNCIYLQTHSANALKHVSYNC